MDFDFHVENMTNEQAKFLMDFIYAYVAHLGLEMGGGYLPFDCIAPTPIETKGVEDVQNS
jgi:hypothetical protein